MTADREVRTCDQQASPSICGSSSSSTRREASTRARRASRASRDRVAPDRAAARRRSPSCVALGAAVWMRRIFRAHTALVASTRALVEQRAAELELFGQPRRARSAEPPVGADLLPRRVQARRARPDPKLAGRAEARPPCVYARAEHGRRHLRVRPRRRATRSAARAPTCARSVEQVAEEVATRRSARERPEIDVEPFAGEAVACSRGVLTSILSNLCATPSST